MINKDDIKQEIDRLHSLIELHKKTLQLIEGGAGNGRREKRVGKRKLSAAGRARIAAAQRARWAKVRKMAKAA